MANRVLHLNGTSKPIAAPETAGGIDLRESGIKDRVGEIAGAALRDPLPSFPECVEEILIGIGATSTPSNVSVETVRKIVESKRWSLIRDIRALGGHEDMGDFTLSEGSVVPTGQGFNAVRFVLTWKMRPAVPE